METIQIDTNLKPVGAQHGDFDEDRLPQRRRPVGRIADRSIGHLPHLLHSVSGLSNATGRAATG